jgi:uncharacterized membrane protein YdfJ with MMPL/SSD domain
MELLGRSNWYMPRWLDKIVPTLGVEVDVHSLDRPTDDPVPAASSDGSPPSSLTVERVP